MIPDRNDNRKPLFVCATSSGSGGIATLLLDGEDIDLYLEPILRSKRRLSECVTGDLLYARMVDRAGAAIDEVVLARVGKKDSPTGNEQIELSCHGGAGALSACGEALIAAGFARGSGTVLLERAHLNGKLSLIALEARLRLAASATARQAEFLLGHVQFQHHWERLGFEMAMGMRTKSTAWREPFLKSLDAALVGASAGIALLARHRVAIAGPVNAGKSTLSNLLAREQRHLVSPIPGTTLDRLDTPISMRGLNVLLTDTAGLREPSGQVEGEGQRRGQEAAAQADLRLVVLDGSRAPEDAELALIARCKERGRTLVVLNKSDLGTDEIAGGLGFLIGEEPSILSAQSGSGLEELERRIETALLGGDGPLPGAAFTRRQCALLQELHAGLSAGAEATELLVYLRKLVGTRPNPDELAVVLAE